jgi:hypothetical protein
MSRRKERCHQFGEALMTACCSEALALAKFETEFQIFVHNANFVASTQKFFLNILANTFFSLRQIHWPVSFFVQLIAYSTHLYRYVPIVIIVLILHMFVLPFNKSFTSNKSNFHSLLSH